MNSVGSLQSELRSKIGAVVSKYPSKPKPIRKLFIGGLDYRTTKDSLKSYFEQFGTVDAVVKTNPETNQSCFGFITYSRSNMVDKVLAFELHRVDGRVVQPKPAVPQQASMKLFVGGIKNEHKDEDLRQYFSEFGNVLTVNIIHDKDNGKRRGFAFVEFYGCNPVVLKGTHILMGRKITVKKALSKIEMDLLNSSRGGGGRDGGVRDGRGDRDRERERSRSRERGGSRERDRDRRSRDRVRDRPRRRRSRNSSHDGPPRDGDRRRDRDRGRKMKSRSRENHVKEHPKAIIEAATKRAGSKNSAKMFNRTNSNDSNTISDGKSGDVTEPTKATSVDSNQINDAVIIESRRLAILVESVHNTLIRHSGRISFQFKINSENCNIFQ